MTTLPPELAAFASLLDAQPAPVRDAFNTASLDDSRGRVMRLVETVPGENGTVCVRVVGGGQVQRGAACNERGGGNAGGGAVEGDS